MLLNPDDIWDLAVSKWTLFKQINVVADATVRPSAFNYKLLYDFLQTHTSLQSTLPFKMFCVSNVFEYSHCSSKVDQLLLGL